MKWVGCGLLALLLALPASRGEDPPKKEPPKEAKADPAKDEKKLSPKERYAALVKDFRAQQGQVQAEIRKVKGPEQDKLWDKYDALPKQFVDRFYELAEEHPKDPAGVDALFWVVQNGTGTPVHPKALDKVTALVGDMPLKDLSPKLRTGLPRTGNAAVLGAVLKRAEAEEKDPEAPNLLVWVATAGFGPPAETAIDRLLEKYPDHAGLRQVTSVLGRMGSPKAAESLKKIVEKSPKKAVQGAAALALGRTLASQTDRLGDQPAEADKVAAEAEKYLLMVTDDFAKGAVAPKKGAADAKAGADFELTILATQRTDAEQELKALRTLRVGKEAPEIKAPDLDGKEFKLSDYRGKVVLLDFWGDW